MVVAVNIKVITYILMFLSVFWRYKCGYKRAMRPVKSSAPTRPNSSYLGIYSYPEYCYSKKVSFLSQKSKVVVVVVVVVGVVLVVVV